MKDKILGILYFLWGKLLPILLVTFFFVGVFFNLWKIQNIPLGWSIVISIVCCVITGLGFGKLIKLW